MEVISVGLKLFEFDSEKVVERIKDILVSIDNTLVKAVEILSQNPQEMTELWRLVEKCSRVCMNIALSLMVLFWLVSFIFKLTEMDWKSTSIDFFVREIIKLILAKAVIEMSMDLCIVVFNWGGVFMSSLVNTGLTSSAVFSNLDLSAIKTTFEGLSFFEQMWFKVELLTPMLIMQLCNLVIEVICYGRVLQICLMTIIAPIPLSTIAGERHKHTALNFIKEYTGVVLQGAVIVLILGIYKGSLGWIIGSIGAIGSWTAIWKLVMVTIVLVFSIIMSSKLAKMFVGH